MSASQSDLNDAYDVIVVGAGGAGMAAALTAAAQGLEVALIEKSAYFGGLSPLQYYVPTIAALCVLGSCYGQLAVALAARRQNGIL